MNYDLIYFLYNIIDSRIKNGYVELRMKDPIGRRHWIKRYKLVYEVYIGERIKGMHIHHKDHNKLNDHWNNLQQITREEHAAIHGIVYNIEGNGSSRMLGKKHSEETKNKMSKSAMGNQNVPLFRSEHFKEAIAKKQKNFGNSKARKDISIEEVVSLFDQGFSRKEIAKILDCSVQVIVNRLKWSKA